MENPSQKLVEIKAAVTEATKAPTTMSGHRSILNTILHVLGFLIPLVESLFHTPTGVSSVVGGQAASVDTGSEDSKAIEGSGTTVVDGGKAAGE